MSRGAGQLQRLILGHLDVGAPIQLNDLCWQLAAQEGRVTAADGQGEIDRSFYSSFLRAVGLLGRRVIRSRRKLQSLDELVAYYPFKTRTAFVKGLRQRLLPVMAHWLSERNAARFRKAQTEHYLLNKLPISTRSDVNAAWPRIETALFDAISRLQGEPRTRLLSILVKGQELFVEESHVREARSLGALIDLGLRLEWHDAGGRRALIDAKTLYDTCFPSKTVNHAWLKSQLYSVVSLSRWGPSVTLSDEVKGALLERDREFVAALPGHVHAHLKRVGNISVPRKVEYSPSLDQLIRKDALGQFEFVTVAPKS